MHIKNVVTGSDSEAVIEPITRIDFRAIKKDKARFNKFNWDNYKDEEVFKLRLKSNNIILGLICLIDHKDPATNAIEIELLEVSEENIGSGKPFDHIGACLIAFACRESFKRGHDGFVFLTPKSQLVEHYIKKYGFRHLPIKTIHRPEGLMVLYSENSRKMISRYLKG